jgi:ABC-2 type transport system permease protein
MMTSSDDMIRPERARHSAGIRGPAGPLSLMIRDNGVAIAAWTVAIAGISAVLGSMGPDIRALLDSADGRDLIRRLGGAGALRDAFVGAELLITAAVVTAFGINVVHHAAIDERSGRTAALLAAGASRAQVFAGVAALALVGTAWLLLVTGTVFALVSFIAGGPMSALYVAAAINHAPAVWTVVCLAIVAWSLRPRWILAGWGLLVLFVSLAPVGQVVGAPQWLVDFSPYARTSLMPAERFDLVTTVALTAGVAVLLALSAFNFTRRDVA